MWCQTSQSEDLGFCSTITFGISKTIQPVAITALSAAVVSCIGTLTKAMLQRALDMGLLCVNRGLGIRCDQID